MVRIDPGTGTVTPVKGASVPGTCGITLDASTFVQSTGAGARDRASERASGWVRRCAGGSVSERVGARVSERVGARMSA